MGYEAGDRLDRPVGGFPTWLLPALALAAAGTALLSGVLVDQVANGPCGSFGPACPFSLDPSRGSVFAASVLIVTGVALMAVVLSWLGWNARPAPPVPDLSPKAPAPHAPAWGTDEEEAWNGPLPP